ncbi:hypothetical protein DFQ26_001037, partial [Actinomortierella ambigua]
RDALKCVSLGLNDSLASSKLRKYALGAIKFGRSNDNNAKEPLQTTSTEYLKHSSLQDELELYRSMEVWVRR